MQYKYNKEVENKLKEIKQNSVKAYLLGNYNIPKEWKKRQDLNKVILPSLSKNKLFNEHIIKHSYDLSYKSLLQDKIKYKEKYVTNYSTKVPSLKPIQSLDLDKLRPDLNDNTNRVNRLVNNKKVDLGFKYLNTEGKKANIIEKPRINTNKYVLNYEELNEENKDRLLDYDLEYENDYFNILKHSGGHGNVSLTEGNKEKEKISVLQLYKKGFENVKPKINSGVRRSVVK